MAGPAKLLNAERLIKSVLVPRGRRGATFDCDRYAGRRLDPQLALKKTFAAPQLELHLGTFSQTERRLKSGGCEATLVPDKTFPEVWVKVSAPGQNYKKYIVSNILGWTRLRHFLAMLKLRGFPASHLTVYDFQNDYKTLALSRWGETFRRCQTAIFTFNPQNLAHIISGETGLSETTVRDEFLEFVSLTGEQNIIVFNLQHTYGSQIVPFLFALLRSARHLRMVMLLGAGGGIDPRLNIGDLVYPRRVYNYRSRLVSRGGNHPLVLQLPVAVHELDVLSAQTLFSETSDRIKGWRSRDIGAIDLESSHAASVMKRFPRVEFGTILRISDLPGKEELTTEASDVAKTEQLTFERQIAAFLCGLTKPHWR